MNRANLQQIFKKYIDHFDIINNQKNDETYKWEIAYEFQNFDVDAEDFEGMLGHMLKVSANLVDSSQQLPFHALVDYAQKEPETVREMFRKLYASESLDYAEKQKVIDEFIRESEELRKKYYPDSRLYVNNQRSVMMYLFLRYPNSNYAYKASQAKSFADCIEFYEDWGPMTHFNLEAFYRMCDLLVEEIKSDAAILATHQSRFEHTDRKLHPDENFHILAFDIIFSSQVYDFYDGMTFEAINAQARKLYFERVAKARELSEILEKAKEDLSVLEEAKNCISESVTCGVVVKHKSLGEGIIKECTDTAVTVHFSETGETKRLGVAVAFCNGILTLLSDELTQKVKKYASLLSNEANIRAMVARTEEAMQEYLEFLD